jgi:hypothetical protein
MIEEKKVYPISCIRELSNQNRMKLVSSGIVIMKQLVKEKPSMLAKETGISRDILAGIIEKAKTSTYLNVKSTTSDRHK